MIRFYCSHCGRPIEVDDAFAGAQATCPYCHQVTTVPQQSTYRPGIGAGPGPATIPTGGTSAGRLGGQAHPEPPPVPPAEGLHIGEESARRETGRRLGRWALICTLVGVGLSAAVMTTVLIVLFERVDVSQATPPTPEQQLEIMEEVIRRFPWVPAVEVGLIALYLAGLSLAITSMVHAPRWNWAGLISLVICSLMVLCFCTGMLTRLPAPAALIRGRVPAAPVDIPRADRLLCVSGKDAVILAGTRHAT